MFELHDAVFCPGRIDTGCVRGFSEDDKDRIVIVALDYLEKEVELRPGEICNIRWKQRTSQGNFLIIARAWKGLFGGRNIKIQYHRIRDDGSVSGRVWTLHRVNGRTRKFGW